MKNGFHMNAKSMVLAVIVIGVLMAAVDTTIVVLALPTIDVSLSTSPLNSIWIILSYILVLTILSSQVGRLGDRYGRARLYKYGLGVFVLGSALCGLAPNISFLNSSRIIQAIGGALLGTTSAAVLSDHFEPHERGKAFGYLSIGWSFGAILGIFLGGFLSVINWRLIFYINVPIGLALIPIAIYKLRDVVKPMKEPLDLLGGVLLGIGLLTLTLTAVFSMFEGITSLEIALFFVSLLILLAFVLRERRIKYPTINFSMFSNRIFTFSVIASMLQSTASFAVLFLLILYLQGVRGLNAFDASIYLIPGYLIGGIVGPLMGRLSDKIGARVPATLGLAALGFGYFAYATLLGVNTPLYIISLITILTGLGTGSFFPANTSAIMANAPKDKYAMASGLNRMLGNVGMVLSFVIALTVISSTIPRSTALAIFSGSNIVLPQTQGVSFLQGLDYSLYASIIVIALAAIMSLTRGKEDRRSITDAHRDAKLAGKK